MNHIKKYTPKYTQKYTQKYTPKHTPGGIGEPGAAIVLNRLINNWDMAEFVNGFQIVVVLGIAVASLGIYF